MALAQELQAMRGIEYAVQATGLVLCRNRTGLIFFLVTEPPSAAKANPSGAPSAPPPKAAPRLWAPVPTTQEVTVHHDAPRSSSEAMIARPREVAASFTPVPSDHEVAVVRDQGAPQPSPEPDLSKLSPAQAAVARLKPQVGQAQPQAPTPPAPRGTAPLEGAPGPSAPAQGGWFRKLFSGH